jgi:hypothetical protein
VFTEAPSCMNMKKEVSVLPYVVDYHTLHIGKDNILLCKCLAS